MMIRTRAFGACLGAWLGACICAGIWPTPDARAQVLRCTDAGTGKVTYTDGACASDARVRQVQPRRTPEEIQQERAQAAEALARQQALRDTQNEREQLASKPPKAAEPPDHARSPECARSRRHLEETVRSGTSGDTYEQNVRLGVAQRQMDLDCLGPKAYADLEKARAARPMVIPPVVLSPPQNPIPADPAPPRKQMTQCNVFRCYDRQGRSYPH
ncbi:DUF4124 domain-containing protein [Verminephrobacter eiseniae]|uniref:DUF4124 domain-containing protein n=1 Tax=Verminephrobacter eiseniae TaxID=364317 RepID=UPI00223780C6|nr:DUF4124 domain-containing protein [Verminephrobacter eiseniae]MCW5235435.1 DUF4124 domain-containing protein [Verminephrobacter eiseniae]